MNRAVALVCGICHSVFSIPNPHTEFVPTLTNKKLSPYGSAWPFAGRLSSCVKVFAFASFAFHNNLHPFIICHRHQCFVRSLYLCKFNLTTNQRIIAENAQFTGIAAGQGVGFTTGLLHLRKGLGMRETPIRPHSWHCRMQSDYQYDGNRKRPPVWRRHRGSLRPRGRNLGRVEGMTGSCGSGCDPAIHARRLRVYHRPRRLRMASRISIFFAARRFEPLNSMG